jgi:lipopolysaccharide biosynthesis glycosyltransferase
MDLFDQIPVGGWYTRATLMRLLAPSELPDWADRALLIDSDVVVVDDLSHLMQAGRDGRLLTAVENFSGPTVATSLPRLYAELGLDPETPYFNAGIMALNLRRWRTERVTERVIAFLNRYGDRVDFLEQDALNAVVAGDYEALLPRWNVQLLTLSHFGRQAASREERRRLQDRLLLEAGILHFAGPRKPWHWRYGGPRADAFYGAVRRSGWFSAPAYWAWALSHRVSHFVFRQLSGAKRIVTGAEA